MTTTKPTPHKPSSSPKSSSSTTQNDVIQALIPTQNKPALIAYYCGVFGLIPILGMPFTIAAIIMGLRGLAQYKQHPTPGAKVHGMIGLWLGVVQAVVFVAFIVFLYSGKS